VSYEPLKFFNKKTLCFLMHKHKSVTFLGFCCPVRNMHMPPQTFPYHDAPATQFFVPKPQVKEKD